MFIAHLPASYCLTTLLLNRRDPVKNPNPWPWLWIGMVAGICPDLDMLYFYLIDNCQHPHHSYPTHIPIYWLAAGICIIAWGRLVRNQTVVWGTVIVVSNILLHLILDSVASRIKWLYPFSEKGMGIFHIPSQYGWWVWNYIFHWTFAMEVSIVVAAVYLLYYKGVSKPSNEPNKGRIQYAGNRFDRGR